MTDVTDIRNWRKSSRSNGANGSCVEVGAGEALIAVRDSKNRGDGGLLFTKAAWTRFLRAVNDGSIHR